MNMVNVQVTMKALSDEDWLNLVEMAIDGAMGGLWVHEKELSRVGSDDTRMGFRVCVVDDDGTIDDDYDNEVSRLDVMTTMVEMGVVDRYADGPQWAVDVAWEDVDVEVAMNIFQQAAFGDIIIG